MVAEFHFYDHTNDRPKYSHGFTYDFVVNYGISNTIVLEMP